MKKNKRTIFIYFTIFLMLFVFPILNSITRNSIKTIATDNKNDITTEQSSLYCSIKDGVEQDIILEGYIYRVDVPIYKQCVIDNPDEKIMITITQGERKKSKVFCSSEFDDSIKWNLPIGSFLKGNALLEIEALNVLDENDYSVMCSDSISSGLGVARNHETDLNRPLLFSYKIIQFNVYFFYSLVGIMLIIGLTILLAKDLTFRDKAQWKKNHFYFYICTLIFLIISVNNPQASFFAEPVSEMTYEFWYKAHNMSFFECMMSLMSGECLVWMERLFMFVADWIAPTKYVFVVAQLFEVIYISCAAAMLCLDDFEKILPIEVRIPLAVMIGAYGQFPSSYYFWTLSYWAVLFITFFAFLDMKKMSRLKYYSGLVFSIILCVSRLYNVVFIPIAIILFFVMKKRGKRFRTYCLVVALASGFEVVYSLIAGGTNHLSAGKSIDILLFIKNTFYWYIEAFNSFIFGDGIKSPGAVNLLSFTLLIVLFGWIAWLLFSKDKTNIVYGTIILCAGIMGGGAVMLNVVTSYMSNTVQMAHNYGTEADWTKSVFQNSDFHFVFAYFSFVVILAVIFSFLWKKNAKFDINKTGYIFVGTCAILFTCYIVNSTSVGKISDICVDWKNTCFITEWDNYYMAVNNRYGTAQISLTQNSLSKVIGRDENGKMYEWKYGDEEYTHDDLYSVAELNEIAGFRTNDVIALTVEKALINFDVIYYANFYDNNDKLLASVKQSNSPDRRYADFYMETPINNIAKVSFTLEEGYPVYVKDALQFGIYDINCKSSTDIHCSIDYCNGMYTQEGQEYSISKNEDEICLEGWAEKVSVQDPVDRIDVICNEKIIEASVGLEKSDVAKILGDEDLLYCGWNVKISSEDIYKDSDNAVELVVYSGDEYKIFMYYFNFK